MTAKPPARQARAVPRFMKSKRRLFPVVQAEVDSQIKALMDNPLVGAFGWVLTYSKFPFRVAEAIGAVAPTWWLFMMFVIVLYVFLGTFLTPSEIILVTVPVLLPGAQALGIHPIHFGMVCVIASAVGHITPPVGLCLFVGMAVSDLPMEKLVKPLLPFLGAIIAVLLVVAFVPETVLFIPRLLGFVQ